MTWICCVAASCPFCSSCLFVSCCAQHDQPQCGQSAAGREGAETHRSSFAIFHHWSCCRTIAGTNPYHYSPSQHAQATNAGRGGSKQTSPWLLKSCAQFRKAYWVRAAPSPHMSLLMSLNIWAQTTVFIKAISSWTELLYMLKTKFLKRLRPTCCRKRQTIWKHKSSCHTISVSCSCWYLESLAQNKFRSLCWVTSQGGGIRKGVLFKPRQIVSKLISMSSHVKVRELGPGSKGTL